MKSLFKYHLPAILWALFIFILCAIKLGSISESPIFFPGFDKLVHCGLFFGLVVFYSNGLIRKRGIDYLTYSKALLIILVAIAYGGAIELLQLFIFTWRSGEWNDLFADTVGACMGIFSVLLTIKAVKNGKV
jgi:VanZ family protein